MRVVVTGGCGFIGAYLSAELLDRGHDVAILDTGTPKLVESVVGAGRMGAVRFISVDVADAAQVAAGFEEVRPDAVVHLAHLLGAGNGNLPLALRVNCAGAANVFEAALEHGLIKLVWASSVAIWGPRSVGPDGMVDEDALPDPQSVYGSCKAFVEQIAPHYAARGLRLASARLPIVYGAGRLSGNSAFLSEMIAYALADKPYTVPGPEFLQNFLYVADAAACLADLLEAERNEVINYNVCGALATNWEFAAAVARQCPGAAFSRGDALPLRDYAARLREGRIARDAGFRPRYDLDGGIGAAASALKRGAAGT